MGRLSFICFFAFLPFSVFADTISVKCTYKEYSLQDGIHKTDEDFILRFLIDKDSGDAYVLGNAGSDKVITFGTEEQLTFVELTKTKNAMTTTISLNTFESVHSRNTVSFGKLLPSQYYGTCHFNY